MNRAAVLLNYEVDDPGEHDEYWTVTIQLLVPKENGTHRVDLDVGVDGVGVYAG